MKLSYLSIKFGALSLLWTLSPSLSFAALISYEGFNYSPGSFVTGANSGSGWNSTWNVTGPASVVSDSLSPPNLANPSTGNRLELAADGTANLGASISYGTGFQYNMSQEGTVRYASMLVNKSSIAAAGDEYIQASLGTDGGVTTWLFGMSSSESFFLRSRNNSTETTLFAPGTHVSANKSYLLVSKLVTSASGSDTIYLNWYNQDSSVPLFEPTSWMFQLAVNHLGTTNQTAFRIETGRANNTTFRMDEIRLGTTWSSVVPEPSKSLMTLAGLFALILPRKRTTR